jgi:hypothetical protein
VLPTFVVIGAAKAGTTSLHAYLGDHPDVFVSEEKELNFFIAEKRWDLGTAWYEAQFAAAGSATARGEVSPLYSAAQWYASVPERMAAVVPDVRLVYVIRHPLDRMRSHYLQHLDLGMETRRAARALREDRGYLDSSRYGFQLHRYLDHFDRAQVLVIRAEDLRDRRQPTMADVFRFIGVDPSHHIADASERHRSEAKALRRPIANAVRRREGLRTVTRHVPRPLRNAYGRLTTRPAAGASSVAIPAALEADLLGELRDDLGALRAIVGPEMDLWGLA